MKHNLLNKLALFFISILALQCTNPVDDVQLKIDGNSLIKYSAVFEVAEANGGSTAGLTVEVTGEDAAAIYDLGGTKNYQVKDGMVSFGVDPHYNPTATDPVKFEVVIKGEGFVTERIPVSILKDQFQQLRAVKVMKVQTPPPGASGVNKSTPLTGGATVDPIDVETPVGNGTSEPVKLTLPSGTSFIDANGNAIDGANLVVSMMNYNAMDEDAVEFFPGGSLVQDNVIVDGEEMTATFIPAGFVNIEMFVSGTAVKKFSKPIAISMGISADFQNPITSAPVKAGDMLGVYSYEVGTGKWKFEQNSAVTMVNGKLAVNFTTDHLTWFMAGAVFTAPKPTVTPKTEITFKASWLKGSSLPVIINIYRGRTKIKDQIAAITDNGKVQFSGIMSGEYVVEVRDNETKDVLFTGPLSIPSSHQASITIEIPSPAAVGPLVNMHLKIQCPNISALITPPDFFIYYKEASSTADYKLLGLVKGGDFTTQKLDLNKKYHFKAVWGSKTKIVLNRQVSTENLLVANKNNAGKGGCGCAEAEVGLFLQECENFTP